MANEHESKQAEHDKQVTIIVNGRKKTLTQKEISFEEVVNLAFDNNPPSGPMVVITVAYSRGESDQQGTLLAGKKVKLKDGMVFNVKATDRS